MLDFWLVMSLGFLGSFGHCLGMCSPLTVAFSLSHPSAKPSWQQQLWFHLLLNLGRVLSYTLVGAGIGGLGSVLIAGGQMAGVGSQFRQFMAIATGIMLIWFGLTQIKPDFLPRIPLLHPLLSGSLHNHLSRIMGRFSAQKQWWTPWILGMIWGWIPCGFLYAAQIKAASTGDVAIGAITMLSFGLGTLPTMVGVGFSTSFLSQDKRSQLFRLGGWITLIMGVITVVRTGDTMTDYTGHAALFCLILALIARPLSGFYAAPLRYRRLLGVSAFILGAIHTTHMIEHSWQWNFAAFWFLTPDWQVGIIAGAIALLLMLPATLTSFNSLQTYLGKRWRQIHLLTLPSLLFAVSHAILIGSHYLGSTPGNQPAAIILAITTLMIFLLRQSWFWHTLGLSRFYTHPKN
ncbi:urease accessory protein UreH domain-containing protein [Calothrix sp. 336/3]|uniref:urease accessory protein UreH domain-containing protein n=1 Tax=Calothrix sp. 336/3 TaxID=1337936 RepID=UPI0004E3C50A|nr:sulfite exporter TauE/SafE family protein [Calothrix sp. 336/3]AKG24317.1 ferric reductase [Calothrix sp. 336/3]